MQKRSVRAMSHQGYLAHSLPILKELKLLRLSHIFKLELLTFIFKSTNKITPVCFCNFFSSNSSMYHCETRQSVRGNFYEVFIWLGKHGTIWRKNAFITWGATLWNNLSVEIRNSTSKFLFFKILKLHLLNSIQQENN